MLRIKVLIHARHATVPQSFTAMELICGNLSSPSLDTSWNVPSIWECHSQHASERPTFIFVHDLLLFFFFFLTGFIVYPWLAWYWLLKPGLSWVYNHTYLWSSPPHLTFYLILQCNFLWPYPPFRHFFSLFFLTLVISDISALIFQLLFTNIKTNFTVIGRTKKE